MPASTLDILHNNWEYMDKIVNDLRLCCLTIKADFFLNDDEVQIHKKYANRDADLILEIESENSLEWYYKEYPLSKLEPEDRIPYLVFDPSINGGEKLFTIISANCYLDEELIFDFFIEYLKLNQEKFININRSIGLSYRDLEKVALNGGYFKGWLCK